MALSLKGLAKIKILVALDLIFFYFFALPVLAHIKIALSTSYKVMSLFTWTDDI